MPVCNCVFYWYIDLISFPLHYFSSCSKFALYFVQLSYLVFKLLTCFLLSSSSKFLLHLHPPSLINYIVCVHFFQAISLLLVSLFFVPQFHITLVLIIFPSSTLVFCYCQCCSIPSFLACRIHSSLFNSLFVPL